MHQKINRWKKRIAIMNEELKQKSIKKEIKIAIHSIGYMEYIHETAKSKKELITLSKRIT